mgnify:CR=1 FL=1
MSTPNASWSASQTASPVFGIDFGLQLDTMRHMTFGSDEIRDLTVEMDEISPDSVHFDRTARA